jgi:hypothetical protein
MDLDHTLSPNPTMKPTATAARFGDALSMVNCSHRDAVSVPVTAAYLILVRSMRCLGLLSIAVGLSSCTTTFIGAYADSISAGDRREIEALVATTLGIHHKEIVYVQVVRPDHVWVESAQPINGWLKTNFIARKRQGHWIIEKNFDSEPR